MRWRRLFAQTAALLTLSASTCLAAPQQEALDSVNFRQQIGNVIPANLHFTASGGESLALHTLAEERPLVLVMSWFDCPHLCPMVLSHLATATSKLPFAKARYEVAVVSIDPEETPSQAQHTRAQLKRQHGDAVSDWHLLTGTRPAIGELAQAVGFQYAYDAERDRYAHPAGLVIVNPGGTIGRYLFGIRPEPGDLKLALVEAGEGKLGTPIDQLVLRCYRFDPESGRYNVAVIGTLRWVGGAFLLALAGLFLWLRRRERARMT
ncbi:SCO family protein [Marinimicrobium locisalis]|uniref:SCO family protein n=1 Tax=Marinimicrobium locisalis TaxID=546022 RepID=UPI003221674B